jgi:1-acyl-sn-glycerol-3-phosphate acyltransferase
VLVLYKILAGLRAFILFPMMLVYITAYSIKSIFVPHSRERALKLRKHFARYFGLPILNIVVSVDGEPNVKPAIYVSNHRSFADPIIMCKYLEAFIIAKAEVSHYPIINRGAELTGVIWVDRGAKDSRAAARAKIIETLAAGYNILVFPEGTVGKDASPLPFRPGTFMEAVEHGYPIVPIAIDYRSKRDLWVLEKFVPQYFYQFSKWKTEVKVKFGPPMTDTDGHHLADKAYRWISGEMAQMQAGWSYVFPGNK